MYKRLLVSIGIVLLLAIALAGSAQGHARFLSSDPVDGAVLETAPAGGSISFNEPVTLIEDGLRLFDAHGGVQALNGGPTGQIISFRFPGDLADGSYVISWRVISADSHPVSGTVTFAIGAPSESEIAIDVPQESKVVDRVLGAVQGIGYAALLAMLGLAFFRQFVLSGNDLVRLNWSTLFACLGLIASVCWSLMLPLTVIRQQGGSLSGLFERDNWISDPGTDLWISLIVVLVSIVIADQLGNIEMASPLTRSAAGLAIVGAAAAFTFVGHTRVFEPTWLIVMSNMLHVASGAFWLGGLLGLALTIRAARRNEETSSPDSRNARDALATIVRFSTLAAGNIVVLAVSGGISAWRIVPSFGALISTRYGNLLLAKIGITAIVVAIAAWNRYRLVPSLNRERSNDSFWMAIGRTVRAELVLVVAVALVTGFLIIQSPQDATSSGTDSAGTTLPNTSTFDGALGSGSLTGTLTPGVVGTNTIEVRFVDDVGETVIPIEDPTLEFSLPDQDLGPFSATVISMSDDGVWTLEADVPLPGTWSFRFLVRTSRFEEPIAEFPLEIAGG